MMDLSKAVGSKCPLCGERMEANISVHSVTRDHIIPKSHGGKSTEGNIRYVCRACNLTRGAAKQSDLTDLLVGTLSRLGQRGAHIQWKECKEASGGHVALSNGASRTLILLMRSRIWNTLCILSNMSESDSALFKTEFERVYAIQQGYKREQLVMYTLTGGGTLPCSEADTTRLVESAEKALRKERYLEEFGQEEVGPLHEEEDESTMSDSEVLDSVVNSVVESLEDKDKEAATDQSMLDSFSNDPVVSYTLVINEDDEAAVFLLSTCGKLKVVRLDKLTLSVKELPMFARLISAAFPMWSVERPSITVENQSTVSVQRVTYSGGSFYMYGCDDIYFSSL